ncbi:MAG: hypothetical protein J6T10_29040 [Methanobrevibacter sp.]|nr:hypothetical protein [Methanobrevibacter sp.]
MSNYHNNTTESNFFINVNQNGNNCPSLGYSDGNHNVSYTVKDLSNAIWNSNISTEQASVIATYHTGTTQYAAKRNGAANNNYTCDTDFSSTLGNYGSTTLSYMLSTNPPKSSYYNTCLFAAPQFIGQNTDRHWRGKFYRMEIKDANGALKHRFYPAQRKSDNRIGVYDDITNTFYPEVNNCNYNNYNLQIGAVVDENPTG